MKASRIWLGLLFMSAQTCVMAGAPPLEKLGQPWRAGYTPIQWEARIDGLPKSATVYRVVADSFPPAGLRSLLALAGLTEKDRGRPMWTGAQPEDMWFTDADGARSLAVHPAVGYLDIFRNGVVALPGQRIDGVPDWPEALRLAEALLPKIGVDRAQLVQDPEANEPRYTKILQTMVGTPISRQVVLYRSFDGIPSVGLGCAGGVRFSFGNNGQLAELEMTWRKVVPQRKYAVATKDQFLGYLKEGHCVCRFDSPSTIQTFTVKEVNPYYLELRSWEPQQEIHPVAELYGYAQLPTTNLPISIYCPLLDYGQRP
ncbi:MAG TPA: hypothetical protein VMP11_09015 [Verrucomicrobiae bacterium]|nr:hypothetical protein [Verrucomicrobiae bacterium]